MTLRVLHVMPSFYPATRYGGPIESVLRLCQSLMEEGIVVSVVTTNADGEGDLDVPTDRPSSARGVPVRYFRRFPRTRYAFSAELGLHLFREIPAWDLLHITALFSYSSELGMALAARAEKPYVVSPRGTLMPWALGSKRWKKAPYFHLIEKPLLHAAAGVHATSEEERDAILRQAPSSRAFVVPNGVDLPQASPGVERDPNKIVFLGRIHPVKGFDVLIPALRLVKAMSPAAKMVIAGPDEEGYWARVEEEIRSTEGLPQIRYLGPVRGQEKVDLLASAAVLVLPSHGENFGMAVAEALACTTPVVVSKHCPWKVVEQRGAGFWVENTKEELANALSALLRDPARARKMGEAGGAIARELGWKNVAKQMIAAYEEAISLKRRR